MPQNTRLKNSIIFETTFGSYTAVEIIGEGGAGQIYRAVDEDGNFWAIKWLDPKKATKEKVKRFKNELQFCSRNSHPNIVTVFEHGVFMGTDGQKSPFYVMQFYEGSLRDLLRVGVAPNKALSYFGHLLDGVEAAHLKNVVHRDLKPENILYDARNDRLLVADFGIARFEEDELYTAVETKDSSRLANFQYAAPEQRTRGVEVDNRADIYALGLILNEMFTGKVPHGTSYKIIAEAAPEYEYLDALVSDMLRQSPEDRPPSIEIIKQQLIGHKNEFIARQRISELKDTVIPVTELDDPLTIDPPRLVDFDWDPRGRLTLTLHRPVNDNWRWAFHNMGSYSFIADKGPERFSISGATATIDSNERDVQRVIDHFKEWLPKVNRVYEQKIRREQQESEEKQRKQLQREIEEQEARQRVLKNTKL